MIADEGQKYEILRLVTLGLRCTTFNKEEWDLVHDVTFHDLRHEALSRLAARGFTLAELKRQSGHKSDAALLRYINAVPAEMRKKLEDPEP